MTRLIQRAIRQIQARRQVLFKGDDGRLPIWNEAASDLIGIAAARSASDVNGIGIVALAVAIIKLV